MRQHCARLPLPRSPIPPAALGARGEDGTGVMELGEDREQRGEPLAVL